MTEYGKAQALLAESAEALQDDTRRELDTASRSDLDPIRSQRGIITDGYKHSHVNQCARGSGINGQLENAAAARPPQFCPYDDQASLRIKDKTHKTIAVS